MEGRKNETEEQGKGRREGEEGKERVSPQT